MRESDERRQFSGLVRSFASRFLDNELISSQGDFRQMLVHVLALLGALNFVIALALLLKHYFGLDRMPFEVRRVHAWSDQEFVISCTMVVIGLSTSLIWDFLFPDRRDCLVLTSLPVRMRTIFCAKTAAIGGMLSLAGIAVNAFTALVFPFLLLPGDAALAELGRSALAYAVTMTAAGAFVFFALLGVQGILVQVLPHRQFQRFSSYAQLAAFFVILCGFFLMPPVSNPRGLAAPENQVFLRALPPLWFLGLYQALLGDATPVFGALAERAVWGLALAGSMAVLAYSLGYGRHVRKVIEQAEVVPEGRSSAGLPWASLANRLFLRQPAERAVFHFIVRSMLRSRQHRLLLAFYSGIGLAYVLYGLAALIWHGGGAQWFRLDTNLLAVPLVLSFFLLVGMRAAFSIPLELSANWIFQLTDRGDPSVYLAATRKAMVLLGVLPLVLLPLPAYLLLWSFGDAARHVLFVIVVALILVEKLLSRFQKIPFTCSYLPGRANLKVMFGVYWVLFMFFSFLVLNIELWSLHHPQVYVVVMGIALLALAWQRRKRGPRFAFVYEDRPEAVIVPLNLHP